MSLESFEKNLEEHPKKTITKIAAWVIAAILALTIIGNALGIANIYWEATKAKITAAPRVTKNVYETENIISKVAFFHEKCTHFVADLNIYQNNYQRYLADKEALKTATGLEAQSMREALPNAISDYTAPLNVAQTDAADYNAAAANPTINPFRTIFSQHNLPERIELPAGAQQAYSYHISCG